MTLPGPSIRLGVSAEWDWKTHPQWGRLDASVRRYHQAFGPPQSARSLEPDAAVQRDGVELHLQWHDLGGWTGSGDRPTYRFVVEDVDGLYREFRDAGVLENIKPVSDTSWGTREFHVRDPDGNGLQFYRAL